MSKILVATEKPFAADALEGMEKIFNEAGFQMLKLEKYQDKQELLNAVADVEGIICRSDKITAEVIEAAKNLKIVVRAGAGYDNVDLEAATKHGVVVMNTPGQNSNAVAELAFGLMLNLARVGYTGKAGTELKGKKIGIHAYGHVGSLVAAVAKGFQMDVLAFDPFIEKSKIEADGVTAVEKVEELYANCDYVSLHIPANKHTIKSINYDLLSKMPKGASLINTARKEVIDEDGIMKLFNEREDLKYASDIAPDNADEMKSSFAERVFFTAKKLGAQTVEANINAALAAANQSVGFLKDGNAKFQVNK